MLPLLLVVSTVFACAPDSGPGHTTVTYTFTILPPLSWTYPADGADATKSDPAQSTNATDAQSQIEADVISCIRATIAEYNIPSSSVNSTINYKPIETKSIVSKCSVPPEEGEFAKYKATLYYKCNQDPTEMATSAGNIVLKAANPLTENQWNSVSIKVQNKLIAKGVVFHKNVAVIYA